jgi:maltooligosyltrehalose trehalohydrolase
MNAQHSSLNLAVHGTDSPDQTFTLGPAFDRSGVLYTVWAPTHKRVSVNVQSKSGQTKSIPMMPRGEGYFLASDHEGNPGDLYTFEIDGKPLVPDFASRYQPEGVESPSMVMDPGSYQWEHKEWKRPKWKGQVIYELHVGTFTPEGTYRAAIDKLAYIKSLGVTAIELMPLAESTGERNWGYDGVMLFAPAHSYGTPDDLKALVDMAHGHGLAIILDVVYNHLGPQGNVGPIFSPYYLHSEADTAWGQNFDLDGPDSAPVRTMLKQNIRYWLEEFRFDGFRMDATHAIPDRSARHILTEIADLVHQQCAFIIAEDERNNSSILEAKEGWNFDAAWADDFHHSLRVSQVGSGEPFADAFEGSSEELANTLNQGWLYRGEIFPRTQQPRGTPCRHLPPEKFIYCISNHDQVGNRPLGARLHHTIGDQAYRAASLFLLMLPYTPMIFMGQEWASSSPFYFFTDFKGELGAKMASYRFEEMKKLGMKIPAPHEGKIPDPQSDTTFLDSKLKWNERELGRHKTTLSLYRNALALRHSLFPLGNPDRDKWTVSRDGDVVTVRYFMGERTISVVFAVKDSRQLKLGNEKVLIRSGNLGNDPDHGPETVILEDSPSL